MSEKKRQKKDGKDTNKENQAMREGRELRAERPGEDLRDEFKPGSERKKNTNPADRS